MHSKKPPSVYYGRDVDTGCLAAFLMLAFCVILGVGCGMLALAMLP